jgi:hypothetical protein
MPLYMANSDLAQMKKPFALRSKKRVQMIGLGHPRPQNGLTYTSVSQRVSQKNFRLVEMARSVEVSGISIMFGFEFSPNAGFKTAVSRPWRSGTRSEPLPARIP